MANRILRDWTDSEKIDALSFQAEVFFVRLFMKADDFGCFHANPKLVKSALFPLRDTRETDISRWMDECQKSGLIVLYESEGKKYLTINNFGQRLRAMKRKFPEPDGNMRSNDGELSAETKQNPKQEFETESKENSKIAFEKVYVEIMGSKRWIQDTALHFKKEIPEIIDLLDNFLKGTIKLKEDWYKGVSEVKKHFISVLKIQVEKEKNSAKKENERPTSKYERTVNAATELANKRGLSATNNNGEGDS